MADKKSFVMYKSWNPMLEALPAEKLGELMLAILALQNGEEQPPEDPMLAAMYMMIAAIMKEDDAKYEEMCAARSEGGKKGGRPKKAEGSEENLEKPLGFSENHMKAKKADKDTDKDKEKDIKEKDKKEKAAASAYDPDPEVDQAIKDFVDSRKKLRKPMTDKAIELFIKKLNGMAATPAEKVGLINTAIERGWQTVYPAKQETARSGTPNRFNNIPTNTYDFTSLEKELGAV